VKSKGITNAQIADNTITVANMGNGSVTSDAILDQTIVGSDLAPDISISTAGKITSEALHTTGNAQIDGNLKVTGTIEGGSPVKIAGGLNVLTGNVGIGTSNPTGILQVTTLEGAVPSIFVNPTVGNVGIGTSSPNTGYRLEVDDVRSSGNAFGTYLKSSTGNGSAYGGEINAQSTDGDATGLFTMVDASAGSGNRTAIGYNASAVARGAGSGQGFTCGVYNYNPSGTSYNYGLHATVSGATHNYGVYSIAEKNYFSGKVGIGTAEPTATLKVVGNAEIGAADCSATGANSFAVGQGSKASQTNSVAMGNASTASGSSSLAVGTRSVASGESSVAMGLESTASGSYSMAFGYQAVASNTDSIALGLGNTASGNYSTALGYGMRVSGNTSFGINLDGTSPSTLTQANTMAIMGGKVGIGTTNPQGTLNVNSATNDNCRIVISETGDSSDSDMAGITFLKGTNFKGGIYKLGSSNDIVFYNDSLERIRIKNNASGGYVGIGASAPDSILNINKSGGAFLRLRSNGDGGTYDSIEFGTSTYKPLATGAAGESWNISTRTNGKLWFQRFTSPGGTGTWFDAMDLNGSGDLHIVGALSKGSGSFLIDHPLDPMNKILQHSFVESPDMKNIYDGIAALDGNGEAAVKLPDYFEALNRDFRYQLTPVGSSMPQLFVKQKISNNMFVIGGGAAGGEVSWQVTGTRQDAYAKKHPVIVEEQKGSGDASSYKPGEYVHPDAFK
jgi:hypothetical protein